MSWARRLKRVFGVEIECCARCGGELKIIASIEEPQLIAKILSHRERAAPEQYQSELPLSGYVSEPQLANDVANIPGETVIRYGDAVGTNGADIVSVNEDGSVTLWDAKFRSSATNPGMSPTFTPGSDALIMH